MLRRTLAAGLACALALGCASGGGTPDGGGGGGRDGGGGGRDAGDPVGCDPLGWEATCQTATDLGSLATGDRIESPRGLIERRAGAQWAVVHFPPMATPTPPPPDDAGAVDGGATDGGASGAISMEGGGTPRIRFLRNDGDAYRIEVRTACTSVASCGDGASAMATNILEWSFTDDPAMSEEGDGRFSSRNAPWPETVYVRVYAAEDPACGRYQIEISR